jgi:hypothetical protein
MSEHQMASTVPSCVITQVSGPAVTFTPRQYSHTSLELLSNEILFLIADYLVDNMEAKFYGEQRRTSNGPLNSTLQLPQRSTDLNVPDHSEGVRFNAELYQDDFASSLIGLRGLALTSRCFRAIAQPLWFKTPILSIGQYGRWDENSPIYLFARTLLENPDTTKWPTTLRIDMPESWGGSMETQTSAPLKVHCMAAALIDALDWMQHEHKTMWKWQLQRMRPYPFCAVILSLLPNLTSLYLSSPKTQDHPFSDLFWSTSTHAMTEEEFDDALASLAKCPGLRRLKHYRTDSLTPLLELPLIAFTSLTSLDLTLRAWGYMHPDTPYGELPCIRSLQVDCSEIGHGSMRLEGLLGQFPNLESLELRTLREGCGISFATLVEQCRGVAPTLRKLNVSGACCAPGQEAEEPDVSLFTRLETLIAPYTLTRSTAQSSMDTSH